MRTVVAAVLAVGVALGAFAGRPATATPVAEDVTLTTPSGAVAGSLTLPPGSGRVTAVLFHAGSGPTDRDGNQPGLRNDSLKLLSDALVAAGAATLRTDKRGIAASKGAASREEDLRFGTYVADLVAWTDWLAAHPRVNRIVLLGHSEGALVATLAARAIEAKGASLAGLILVAGAADPAPAILRRQLAGQLPPDLAQASERILAELEAGRTTAAVPPPLMALYRPSVQPYLISWFPIDPAAELAKVATRKLVIRGTTDIQIAMADGERLASVGNAILVTVEGMNHVLRTAPAERSANIATYMDAALPLAPGLILAVTGFLER